jgi:hypothetical protein
MAAFNKSDLANVTRTLQVIMDELGVGDEDEMRKPHMTGEREIALEDDGSADSKLKESIRSGYEKFRKRGSVRGRR